MPPSLGAASALPTRDLAHLMTDAYAGYPVEVRLDAYAFEAWARERDVDLARSRVLLADGKPVGLAVVGVRAREAYLASMGVLPAARGQGAGRLLVDAVVRTAREAGAERMRLEVLAQNGAARRLYAGAGFRDARTLPCYRTPRLVGGNTDVREVPLAEARKRAEPGPANAWPNAWRSAARAQASGFVHPDAGVAVAKRTRTGLVVFSVTGRDPGRVVDGVAALHAGTPASFLNVPDPALAAALEARGWRRFAEQVEMTRAL